MGRSGWWMAVPAALTVVAMLIWANRLSFGAQFDAAVPLVALVVFVGFALWGCLGRGQAEINALTAPAAR
jgi:hypothetical protein